MGSVSLEINNSSNNSFHTSQINGVLQRGQQAKHIAPTSYGSSKEDLVKKALIVMVVGAAVLALGIIFWATGAGVGIATLATVGETFFGVGLAAIVMSTIRICLECSNDDSSY